MPSFRRSLAVCHPASRMFDLVDRIEDYPQFLPWCLKTEVTRGQDNRVDATMKVGKGPLVHTFATVNIHDVAQRTIQIRLARGPFSDLQGHWSFVPDGANCRIDFAIDYEFANRILARMLDPLFAAAYSKIVDAFSAQADATAAAAKIEVLVAYAKPEVQKVVSVSLAAGSTVADAIASSGLCELFAEIDLSTQQVGIFGRQCRLDDQVQNGDRVEIYRPLALDPKLARMRRVQAGK